MITNIELEHVAADGGVFMCVSLKGMEDSIRAVGHVLGGGLLMIDLDSVAGTNLSSRLTVEDVEEIKEVLRSAAKACEAATRSLDAP